MVKELILTVVVRKEQGRYSSWCPELDVASQGDTIEEARQNLQEAVELHVEAMMENGDAEELMEKLGLTQNDLKRDILVSESFSGTFGVPLAI
ncbi:type II toxin-antitoxin system HicB family antitoxin [Candidatus Woesearchaeota archaeon]|nr:type II toxin-antitoxin system HicB family antitoxin [Candidatus Woesearchaeota archaeon]